MLRILKKSLWILHGAAAGVTPGTPPRDRYEEFCLGASDIDARWYYERRSLPD